MFKILSKEEFSDGVYRMLIDAPRIARTRKPGQFVVLRLNEQGERIPLTICDADPVKGSLTLVFQAVGKSTMQLGKMQIGEGIKDIVGPLGRATHIEKYGTVICLGGGIGIAPIYPITQAMKQTGNKVISIIGARSKNLLILEDEMRTVSDELLVTTDDGSYVRKGFTSDVLKEVINRNEKIDLVLAIGPVPMMRVISDVTRPYQIKTMVSLNPIMLDATGMCGCCRVTVGGKTQFACVDGPEFDGHLVDFDELQKRLRTYLKEEKEAVDKFKHSPSCVDLAIDAQKQAR